MFQYVFFYVGLFVFPVFKNTNNARLSTMTPLHVQRGQKTVHDVHVLKLFDEIERIVLIEGSYRGSPKNTAPAAYIIRITDMATNSVMFGDMYGLKARFRMGCVLFKAIFPVFIILMRDFKEILKKDTVIQRTEEWYSLRENMLTASDVATALGLNPYRTPKNLIMSKTSKKKGEGSRAKRRSTETCTKTGRSRDFVK